MKISIITVCYNAEKYIQSAIESVLSQSYPEIEYIIIDGKSKDKTVEIIQSYGNKITKWISEPDKGLYDAMNKGVKMATGDVVGILNADDFYTHNQVIERVIKRFQENPTDTLFADLVYVKEENLDKITRYYSAKGFTPSDMASGKMAPHPTFFVKRACYEKYGNFDTSYKICADFDIMLRLLCVHKVSWQYLPEVIVKMRTGGASTQGIKSTLRINREMLTACRKNGIQTHLLKIYSKYFTKIFQLFLKPS